MKAKEKEVYAGGNLSAKNAPLLEQCMEFGAKPSYYIKWIIIKHA